jgi:hypothetical protein
MSDLIYEVEAGDCRETLASLPADYFDSCVTDPPYGLGFMGRAWDGQIAMQAETWAAVLRVLKPGAHLVAFGGTRTWHRIACAIEDAGFEIRDNLAWLYGQGFPKSLNVGGGRGTALKPSFEPVILARKPLIGTVAANVAKYGTGAINVDGCRVRHASPEDLAKHAAGVAAIKARGGSMANSWKNSSDLSGASDVSDAGRWPPNVLVDKAVAADLDESNAHTKSGTQTKPRAKGGIWTTEVGNAPAGPQHGDSGGVSRYFYCPKANAKERDAGLEQAGWPALTGGDMTDREDGAPGATNPRSGAGRGGGRRNPHPTVKPIELMRWLCRLVTPPGGTVLDPFTGSGSTGCAAMLEALDFFGCELDPQYARLARDRIAHRAA